jgi:hypothetical protein
MTEFVRQKVVAGKQAGGTRYVKYADLSAGDTVVLGKYVARHMVPNFNRDGEVPQHVFDTEDGKVILNSSSRLDQALNMVDFDQYVDITYLGIEKAKNKKGQPYKMHTFDIHLLVKKA